MLSKDQPPDNSANSEDNGAKIPELHAIVIDEIDALGMPDTHSDVQATVKSLLCRWMDAFSLPQLDSRNQISAFDMCDSLHSDCSNISSSYYPWCIIATSNRPGNVDPCLRRGVITNY